MSGRHAIITTEEITCVNGMPAFFAYPSGGGPYPTVVLMHERYGLVKHTKDQAMRCATAQDIQLTHDCSMAAIRLSRVIGS